MFHVKHFRSFFVFAYDGEPWIVIALLISRITEKIEAYQRQRLRNPSSMR